MSFIKKLIVLLCLVFCGSLVIACNTTSNNSSEASSGVEDSSLSSESSFVDSNSSSEGNSSVDSDSSSTEEEIVPVGLEVIDQTTSFTVLEKFVFDGTVYLEYSDGSKVEIDDYWVEYGNYNKEKIGSYSIKVCTNEFESEYQVSVNRRNTFKVLMIGNSFSDDTSEYAPMIAKSLGITDVEVGNLFIGGCSINTHYYNLLNGTAAYDFRYYGTSGAWDYTVGGVKQSLQYAIKYADWDIITFQQASPDSGVSSTYTNLLNLINGVKNLATNKDVIFLFNMTWAYQANSTHSAFPTYSNSQEIMYNSIVGTVQHTVLRHTVISSVIPNGTAIQNARTSFVGDNLTRDGYHLSYDLGRYIAGLTLVAKVTGVSPEEVTYAPSGMLSAYVSVAKESASNAINNPYQVTTSKYTNMESVIPEGYRELSYEEYGWTNTWGFWDSGNGLTTPITNTALAEKFVATKRFTKAELPIGSIIVIESGWQYRPDAWMANNGKPASRPNNVSVTYTEVTEEWWGSYAERAFNVSLTSGATLNDGSTPAKYELAKQAFKIFVPNTSKQPLIVLQSYFLCKIIAI